MTELGLTPSQTAGPYLRIGLLEQLITTALVDPDDPRAIRIRGRLTDAAGDGCPTAWSRSGRQTPQAAIGTRPTIVRTSRSRTASAASAAPGRRTTEGSSS